MSLDFSSHTLGVLGGMGPAATAHFHRLLVMEINRAGVVEDAKFPRVISLSIPLREWDHRGAQDKALVAQQVRQGVNWLESFGARPIAVPCNSVHEFIDSSAVVDIVDTALACCADAKTIGILCSRQTRESKLYERNNNDQRFVYFRDQSRIDEIIRLVLSGDQPCIDYCIAELIASGAEVTVLGCTELSLCEWGGSWMPNYKLRVVDSSRALASALVRHLVAVCNRDACSPAALSKGV